MSVPAAADDRTRLMVEAYARALRQEGHVLVKHPELTFQQLHNRLQWEGEAVEERLAPERERRSTTTPWTRTRTPYRESAELIRTLTTDAASGCFVSSDGAFVASSTQHGCLHFWDPTTGGELHRLELGGARTALALSPDGSFMVTVGENGTLEISDVASGAQRAALAGHTGEIDARAISPDGTFVVSASDDSTLKVWDATTGEELATLAGHHGLIKSFGSPIKREEIGWSATVVETVPDVGDAVRDCAVSPDASFVVSRPAMTPPGPCAETQAAV